MIDGYPNAMEEFTRGYERLFGIRVQNWGQNGNRLRVGLPNYNGGFKDSKYYCDPAKQVYSHLTSYNKLFSILNSGKLRLYNLKNSNDQNELFIVKGMTDHSGVIENLKEHVFTFSFCKVEDIANPKLWDKYGTVALNFEIVNAPEPWHDFRMSQMFYDTTPIADEYNSLIEDLYKKYPGFRFQDDDGSLISIHAFHKEMAHSYEKEYRIMHLPHLFRSSFQRHFDFRVSDYHTGFTEYIELPLYSEINSEIRSVRKNVSRHHHQPEVDPASFPLMKIVSIQFGDNEDKVSQAKLSDIDFELADYLDGKFGYRIEVVPELFETKTRLKT